jgi:uncharacterized membrane protein
MSYLCNHNSAAEKVLALYNTGLLQRAEVESYHSALVAIEAQKAAAVLAAQKQQQQKDVGLAVGQAGASQVCLIIVILCIYTYYMTNALSFACSRLRA